MMTHDKELIEAMARAIYSHWSFGQEIPGKTNWVDNGNSLKQREARVYAKAALDAHTAYLESKGLCMDGLVSALGKMTAHYTELAGCGDCGNWNPELEDIVISSRQILAKHGKGNP